MGRQQSADFAAELVDRYGVAGIDELVARTREAGIRVQKTQLERLCELKPELRRFDDLYFSLSKDSMIAKCLRVLTQLGVTSADDLCGGIRRSMGAGESLDPSKRKAAASKAYELLAPLLDRWPEPSKQDLQGDRRLADLVRRSPGGVVQRSDLEELIRREPAIDATLVSSSYSPVLEMVANGIFGVRGAEIDLAAIETLRKKKKGPWSRWGRLDRDRMWIEVKTSGEAIRVRIPADCRELLEDRQWTLSSPAGGTLGTLAVKGESAIEITWHFGAPTDWIAEEHSAVLEFDIPRNRVRLFSGASVEGDVDPREVDGCVLVGGRWQFTFEVNDGRLLSEPVSIPLCVSGLGGITVGDRETFQCDGVDLEVKREPHSLRVFNIAPLLQDCVVGGFVRVGFQAGKCVVAICDPPDSSPDRLLRYAGLFHNPGQRWPAIGASLGIGGVCDKRRVRQALADRERFDLIPLLSASEAAGALTNVELISTDQFATQDGRLLLRTADGARCAEQERGEGPLGLQWTSGTPLSASDPNWSSYCLLIVRVWGIATTGNPLLITRSPDGWLSPAIAGSLPTLRDTLDALATGPGALDGSIIRSDTPLVPLRSLGFLRILAAAESCLQRLVISVNGWTGIDRDGHEFGPSPLAALSLRPDTSEFLPPGAP
jgi:hypothetical protein